MQCLDFRKDLTRGSLVSHFQTQHGVDKGGLGQEVNKQGGGEEPSTLRVVFPEKSVPSPFPVDRCSVQEDTRAAMWMHFWYQHVRYTVVILEEDNLPHP